MIDYWDWALITAGICLVLVGVLSPLLFPERQVGYRVTVKRKPWEHALTGVAAAVAGFVAFSIVYGMLYINSTDHETRYELRQLVLSKPQTSGGGGYFLIAGGGSFGKKDYYYFYVESPNGVITLDKWKIDWLKFKETDDNQAYITCDTHSKDQEFGMGIDENCIFHLPKGSIVNDIDVNLKGKV